MSSLVEELFKGLVKQDYCHHFMKIPHSTEETVYRTLYLNRIKQYREGDSIVTRLYFKCSRNIECYQPACPWSTVAYENSKSRKRGKSIPKSLEPFAAIGEG